MLKLMGVLNLQNLKVQVNQVTHVMSVHGNSILLGEKEAG